MKTKLLLFKNVNHVPLLMKWNMIFSVLMVLVMVPNVFATTNTNIKNSEIIRIDGGNISGGPFHFCVGDGEEDNVYGIQLECESDANRQWVITDESGKILGLPSTPEVVNFDGAGAGVCFIWHLSYADGLEGLAAENNV